MNVKTKKKIFLFLFKKEKNFFFLQKENLADFTAEKEI